MLYTLFFGIEGGKMKKSPMQFGRNKILKDNLQPYIWPFKGTDEELVDARNSIKHHWVIISKTMLRD